jgi:hypothetical protein
MAFSTGVSPHITLSASTDSSSSGVGITCFGASPPTNFTVASETDLNAALQAIDLTGTSSAPGTAYTIDSTGDVTLSGDLWAINIASGDALTINGAGHVLDGGGVTRGFFDYAGAVAINDLTIDNTMAKGNARGGGGAWFALEVAITSRAMPSFAMNDPERDTNSICNRRKSPGTAAFFTCADSAPWTLCIMCRGHPPFPR